MTATGQTALPLPTGVAEDEEVVTIPLNPSDTSTTYTITLTATALQPNQTTGFLGITKVKLGGSTAGNVADNVVSSHFPDQRHAVSYLRRTGASGGPALAHPHSHYQSLLCRLWRTSKRPINTAVGGTDIHLPLGYVFFQRMSAAWSFPTAPKTAGSASSRTALRTPSAFARIRSTIPADRPRPRRSKQIGQYPAIYCGQYDNTQAGQHP